MEGKQSLMLFQVSFEVSVTIEDCNLKEKR